MTGLEVISAVLLYGYMIGLLVEWIQILRGKRDKTTIVRRDIFERLFDYAQVARRQILPLQISG